MYRLVDDKLPTHIFAILPGACTKGGLFYIAPPPNLNFGGGNFFLVYIKKILKLKKKVIKVTLGYISIREHFYMYDYKKKVYILFRY